jgi:leucyl/phenylalanyl-tRNA--protein transferase
MDLYDFNEYSFPPVNSAHSSGILAFGGDLSVDRLISAYKNGIFPWFNPGEQITWYAPKRRMVLFPNDFKASKSLQKTIDKNVFTVTFNQNFKDVISNCKSIERTDQKGTWISDDFISSYCQLNEIGIAKSVEVWQKNNLMGGLYGIDLGHVFCGESMFAKVTDASKVAFAFLVNYLKTNNYKLLDCQVYNNHLESLGCVEIDRNLFMEILKNNIA